VQEAFLAALQRLDQLRDPAAFPMWFRQIVRSQCNRIVRKRQPRFVPEIDKPSGAVPAPARMEREETRRLVRDALASLPGVGREAAQLFYIEEWSCADIADQLSVPLGTVKRRLHDARRRLKAMLLGYVADEGRCEKPVREFHL